MLKIVTYLVYSFIVVLVGLIILFNVSRLSDIIDKDKDKFRTFKIIKTKKELEKWKNGKK